MGEDWILRELDDYLKSNEMNEDISQILVAYIYALTKIYDNYITPLNTRVKCWKYNQNNGYFVVGMTIREVVGEPTILGIEVSNDNWNKFKLMEIKELPKLSEKPISEILMKL